MDGSNTNVGTWNRLSPLKKRAAARLPPQQRATFTTSVVFGVGGGGDDGHNGKKARPPTVVRRRRHFPLYSSLGLGPTSSRKYAVISRGSLRCLSAVGLAQGSVLFAHYCCRVSVRPLCRPSVSFHLTRPLMALMRTAVSPTTYFNALYTIFLR